eukprot:31372-Pelagococcus_subviridis.AAC.6
MHAERRHELREPEQRRVRTRGDEFQKRALILLATLSQRVPQRRHRRVVRGVPAAVRRRPREVVDVDLPARAADE